MVFNDSYINTNITTTMVDDSSTDITKFMTFKIRK